MPAAAPGLILCLAALTACARLPDMGKGPPLATLTTGTSQASSPLSDVLETPWNTRRACGTSAGEQVSTTGDHVGEDCVQGRGDTGDGLSDGNDDADDHEYDYIDRGDDYDDEYDEYGESEYDSDYDEDYDDDEGYSDDGDYDDDDEYDDYVDMGDDDDDDSDEDYGDNDYDGDESYDYGDDDDDDGDDGDDDDDDDDDDDGDDDDDDNGDDDEVDSDDDEDDDDDGYSDNYWKNSEKSMNVSRGESDINYHQKNQGHDAGAKVIEANVGESVVEEEDRNQTEEGDVTAYPKRKNEEQEKGESVQDTRKMKDNLSSVGDSEEGMVYMYVEGSDARVNAILTEPPEGKAPAGSQRSMILLDTDEKTDALESDAVAVSDDSADNGNTDLGSAEKMHSGNNEAEGLSENVYHFKENATTPYLVVDQEYGPGREKVIILSDEQLQRLDEVSCGRDGECHAEGEDSDHSGGGNALGRGSPLPRLHITYDKERPATHSQDGAQVNDEYITQEELNNILNEYENFIVTEKIREEWEPHTVLREMKDGLHEHDSGVTDTMITSSDSTNFDESSIHQKSGVEHLDNKTVPSDGHKTVPFSSYPEFNYDVQDIYEAILQSDQVSEEDKLHITSLEEVRQIVNRLGGFEALHEKPRAHHIVKRQASGREVCGALARRRRRNVDEIRAEERDGRTRRRRGVSNLGRSLEQGNPRFKQLYNQYKKMCDFIAMAVFEK